VVEIAREGNRYLNARAPWELVKTDVEAAYSVLHRAYWSLKMLTVGLAPVAPDTAYQLWKMMGETSELKWEEALRPPSPGTPLGEVKPLFRKITEAEVRSLLKKLDELRSQKAAKKFPWEQALL